MQHRHLTHTEHTNPACVEDVILRGLWDDWVDLSDAMDGNPQVRQAVIQVCEPNIENPFNQRHIFWFQYAQASE